MSDLDVCEGCPYYTLIGGVEYCRHPTICPYWPEWDEMTW